jgi:cellulase/cellobiase CelA1
MRLADDANPLAGMPFYVNPTSAAMCAAQHANRACGYLLVRKAMGHSRCNAG